MNRKIKSLIIASVAIIANIGVVQAETALPAPSEQTKKINSIVAIVNDDVILTSDLDAAVSDAQKSAAQSGMTLPDKDQLTQSVLKQLIYQQLQLQLAKRMNLTVSKDDVNQAIDRIAQQQQMSADQLESTVTAQGLSKEVFYEHIKDQVIISKLQQSVVGPTVSVTQDDIAKAKAALEQQAKAQMSFNVTDVLVPLPSTPTATQQKEAKNTAKSIQAQLEKDSDTDKIQGGELTDLGWVSANQLPDVFLGSLKAMSVGQVSAPIKADNGYHVLVLVDEKHNADKITDEQAKQLAYQQQFNAALAEWLKKLYKQSYIKIMSPST